MTTNHDAEWTDAERCAFLRHHIEVVIAAHAAEGHIPAVDHIRADLRSMLTWIGFEPMDLDSESYEADLSQRSTAADERRGLYRKYHVERTDGSSKPGGKHARCDYFVLDLVHDKHARLALFAYVESCKDEYPQLATDLQARALGGR
jgi:hypothetical protein